MAVAESPADLQLYSIKDLGDFLVLGHQEHESDVGRSGIPWERNCGTPPGSLFLPKQVMFLVTGEVWDSAQSQLGPLVTVSHHQESRLIPTRCYKVWDKLQLQPFPILVPAQPAASPSPLCGTQLCSLPLQLPGTPEWVWSLLPWRYSKATWTED